MKITFAGVGSAFTTQDYWQSNMVVTSESGKRLLIDCGTDARFSFGELGATNANIGEWADGIYISHLHADHIGGLEWIGFCTFFKKPHKKPKLYIVDTLVDDLWDSLKGGMRSHEGRVLRLDSFFDIHAIPINEGFIWEKTMFRPVQTVHIMNGLGIVPSYGLLIDPKCPIWNQHELMDGVPVFLTTDTQFCPRQIEKFYDASKLIFQDCETSPHRSGVHAHYDDLKTLPDATKAKMWLYHYGPNPPQDPVIDGFCGFVTKGQSFDF